MILWEKHVIPTDELLRQVVDGKLKQLMEENSRLLRELSDLKAVSSDLIRKHARVLTDVWTQPTAVPKDRVFIDDPVFGQLCIEQDLCPVLAHPLVQRLNHIKQLAFAYLVFPTATHSRLSYSLGACRLAEMAVETILTRDLLYTEEGTRRIDLTPSQKRSLILKAKAAAMLHDVGHGPFGHALDRLVGFCRPLESVKHPDKKYSGEYIEKFLAERLPEGVDPGEVAAILGAKRKVGLTGWDCLIADLVDSSLDIDRMDYLMRDANMTGLSVGDANAPALIDKMRPFQDGERVVLTYDKSCLPYLGPFLYTREMMFLNCYDHPRKAAAERIFTRLVESLIESHGLPIEEIMMLADEQVLALLALASAGSARDGNLLAVLLQNQEYEVVHERDAKTVESWIDSRAEGLGKQTYVDMPRMWELTIAEEAGLGKERAWQVLVVVPAQEVFIPVELGTRILFRSAGGYTTEKLSQVVPSLLVPLQKLIEARDRIRVFVDARLDSSTRNSVADVCKRVLGPLEV
jgi:hypothetical protein